MRTSGLIYEEHPDGSIVLGYEDYDVEVFDGYDFEAMYYLNAQNAKLLYRSLQINPLAPWQDYDFIEAKLIGKFGKNFNGSLFEKFCKEKKIHYDKNIHIG